ncbi:hypothetical protein TWF696_003596 [Orbilia brochopaga]|uniref:Uncharacterized protein n=1 Tax=Orbilia brochopaga TaxID=3140254 RepID=A0AAV9TZ56_9PEZI
MTSLVAQLETAIVSSMPSGYLVYGSTRICRLPLSFRRYLIQYLIWKLRQTFIIKSSNSIYVDGIPMVLTNLRISATSKPHPYGTGERVMGIIYSWPPLSLLNILYCLLEIIEITIISQVARFRRPVKIPSSRLSRRQPVFIRNMGQQ